MAKAIPTGPLDRVSGVRIDFVPSQLVHHSVTRFSLACTEAGILQLSQHILTRQRDSTSTEAPAAT